MNLRERLYHLSRISQKDRQMGRTDIICKAAKDIGAIVLAANFREATHLQRKYPGVVARSVEMNMDGFEGPFLFDHYAVETLLARAARKIDELEAIQNNLYHDLAEAKNHVKWREQDLKDLAEEKKANLSIIESLAAGAKIEIEEHKKLRQEIQFLRQYGNKMCTAMADEALEEERARQVEENKTK